MKSLEEKIDYRDIKKLQQIIKKIPEKEKIVANTLGKIITILGKYMVKMQGYSILSTVLKREIREVGKENAKFLMNFLKIKEPKEEDIKLIMNLAALLLGLKLKVKNGKVVATECPFYKTLKEYKEPFMCNACVEYNKGIAEELTNGKFTIKRVHWLFEGDKYCVFKPVKL